MGFLFYYFKDKFVVDKSAMTDAEEQALKFWQRWILKTDHYFDQVYDLVRCILKDAFAIMGALQTYLSLFPMNGRWAQSIKGRCNDVPAHRVVNVKGELSGRLMFGEGGKRMAKIASGWRCTGKEW